MKIIEILQETKMIFSANDDVPEQQAMLVTMLFKAKSEVEIREILAFFIEDENLFGATLG